MLKVVHPCARPMNSPVASANCEPVADTAMRMRPMVYSTAPLASTRPAPLRSAIMPKKGCDTPQIRFCSAIANAKVSRVQPWSSVIGCRNRPKPCRVPIARVRMVPPQIRTTAGVRQLFISGSAKRAS
jgi:hypothetical protein